MALGSAKCKVYKTGELHTAEGELLRRDIRTLASDVPMCD